MTTFYEKKAGLLLYLSLKLMLLLPALLIPLQQEKKKKKQKQKKQKQNTGLTANRLQIACKEIPTLQAMLYIYR